MSEANPTPAAKDPPPLENRESAASVKNNAGKHETEESREVAVTSNNAGEVKSGYENGTEGAADENTNIVDADDKNEADLVRAVDANMVDTQNDTEAVDVKMIDTHHEANIEAKDVQMADNQHEVNAEAEDVKMVGKQDVKIDYTQHESNIETEEDACQVKEGMNWDNQYAKATEGEDAKMVETKVDSRKSEAQKNRKEEKEGSMEENKNHDNIEDKGMKMAVMEDACQKEDKERKNEDIQDAKVGEVDEMKMMEAKVDVRNAEVQGNEKKEEMKSNTEEKENDANIEDDVKIVDKEDACQKEDNGGGNEDRHDAKLSEGDEIKIVEAKTEAGNAEGEENGKKEEKASKTVEKKNNANIDTKELKMLDKEDACQKQDNKVNSQDTQDAKAKISDVIESRKKGEIEDKAEDKKNGANIEADNVIMVGKENACQNEDKVGKNDSQDDKAAAAECINTAEAKSDAGNVEVKENGKKEEEEEQNGEKANGVSVQVDNVKITVKEDGCWEEDKERKTEDLAEVDKQEKDNMELTGAEKQDGLKEEGKCCVGKHEVSDRKEIVEESQAEVQRQAKGNVDEQELYDRGHNIEEKHEGLKQEERIDSSKHEVAKISQNRVSEKNEGEEQDGNIPAEKKEEEEQDVKLTAEEKTQDGKVTAEKEEGEEVHKNVAFEKNDEVVIEKGVSEMDEEMEINGKTTGDKQEGKENDQMDDICEQEGQKKGTKRSNADVEESENGSASKKEMDGVVTVEQVGESDKNMEESKNEAPKRKKARTIREKGHENDKKQDDSKSREARELLNTPSPYSLDRPARERKTVKRMVEEIDKGPGGSLIVEKGRGITLKNIPGVAYRISRKKPADLKFLHQILFGRFGKAADFKSHILEFSGFVWHESDEKHRAKAKEKLDKCSIDTLFDLCYLLAVPVSRVNNSRKEDIIAKLLDFIAEPHTKDDSTLSDDQGSNSRKRKRELGSATKSPAGTHKRSRKKLDDEHTSHKKKQKYSESESGEEDAESDEDAEEKHEEEDHIKSGSEENKDDSEQEDIYDPRKSLGAKGSTAKRKAFTGGVPKTAPVATLSKCSSKVLSSSRSSKDKRSAEDSNAFSRKSKSITPKRTTNSEKINEGKSSGLATGKGKSAQAEGAKALPSKDELQKAIARILQKVDLNKATFSDILKMLDEHYKMDLSSRKENIKSIICDELTKLAKADKD